VPFAQHQNADPQVLVRVGGDPAQSVEVIRRRLIEVVPAGMYVNVTPLETIVRRQSQSWELGARMFVAFSAIALLLAAIGLYSVVTYIVAQRTRELGVRIALGATAADVSRLVMGHGVRFAVAGIAAGSVIALLAGRWVQPLLFNQAATDPVIYASAAGLLLVVAILASLRPAVAAMRVNPSQVLQSD
jgi:ABC-type antimicrobial peptide transport system permease subunit